MPVMVRVVAAAAAEHVVAHAVELDLRPAVERLLEQLVEAVGDDVPRAVELGLQRVGRHAEVRARTCDYMARHRAQFEPLVPAGEFEAYVAERRKDKVWGDDPEIRVAETPFGAGVISGLKDIYYVALARRPAAEVGKVVELPSACRP